MPTLQAAVQADPDHADAWAALGLSKQALGQWPVAAESLQRAHALGLRETVPCVWHWPTARCDSNGQALLSMHWIRRWRQMPPWPRPGACAAT